MIVKIEYFFSPKSSKLSGGGDTKLGDLKRFFTRNLKGVTVFADFSNVFTSQSHSQYLLRGYMWKRLTYVTPFHNFHIMGVIPYDGYKNTCNC